MINKVARLLRKYERKPLLVVTGAGISAASGVAVFRGPDGIWTPDTIKKGTKAYFHKNPRASWEWYLKLFAAARDAKPNPAHEALVALEQNWPGKFLLATQNVDLLHEQAGTKALTKVHGSADKVRCARAGCINGAPKGTLPIDSIDLTLKKLPRCEVCNKLIRPHILWFDEFYAEHDDYEYSKTITHAYDAALMIFVGTSFSVGITDRITEIGLRQKLPMVIIDPEPPPANLDHAHHLQMNAEDALPLLVSLVGYW